ncbi:MAG: membrane protein insertase YidC [Cyclobacteriaceae bacterium]|nr:membrane protein insertase YidC [Cyclobacteriaceae bacterium]
MDRNSAIGLTLIAVLLLVYFNFFAPEPPKEVPSTVTTEQTDTTSQVTPAKEEITQMKTGTAIDSLFKGEEKSTKIETGDLIVTFSNRGGVIREVELKKFKTYYQQPLLLASPSFNSFKLNATYEGKEIDLYSLFYSVESKQSQSVNPDTKETADSTIVTFTTVFGEGKSIRHIYTVPANGYQIKYSIQSSGITESINGENLTFLWSDNIPVHEKDIIDIRPKTTVNYFTPVDGFDGISESSLDNEVETLVGPVKWVSIKQKFFTSGFIAKNSFNGGQVSTFVNTNDTLTVKSARLKLFIPKADLITNKANFEFFFGPNDYKVITNITDGFSKNLDLGWPPVSWVNKFVIIPIFNFLETFIGNYGVIIVILVLIIKLILTPLSYSSYLGMAKMRLLKPELDAIKEKNGDNATQAQQDQMKLYQQAGVNPFSGCIPLLLQMPILFAMFYFFPVSIELRQQAFLWAPDLSTYDSIITLPFTVPFGYGDHVSLFVLLMTASTLVSTWQNNQISSVTGPMKSMGYIMPVIFMFVLNSFSAGLSFYYFVSNLVTFAQQAIIKRFVDEDKILAVMDDHKKKAASGTPTKSKFMSKLNDAMKASEEARRLSDEARKKKKN